MRLLHPKRMFHFFCFLIVLAFIIYFNFFYLVYYSLFYIDKDFHIKPENRRFDSNVLQLKSQCECRKDETIYLLKERLNKSYVVKSVLTTNKSTETYSTMETILYQISQDRLQSSILTCDWYNSLRRGPNLKVISYSLYGRNRFYYNFIRDLVKIAKKLYPGWIVRIHYDSSIDESIICEIECLKHLNEVTQKEEYLDNTDFCNIEKLPYDMKSTWNVSYMHGMTWRWLPIGDTFVDFMASRDTDAWISQRELDSVNVWLEANSIFHVMRDNPGHNIPIVGGYWGLANSRNRPLADYLFKILTNKLIAGYYNPGDRNLNGYDQFLLKMFFARYSLRNSTTHDSYSCSYLGGQPWPSKRPSGYCFVGCTWCCDQPEAESKANFICPKSCRPKEHQDWIFC